MIKVEHPIYGVFEIKDGALICGHEQVHLIFDFINKQGVSPWEGDFDYALANKMIKFFEEGGAECKILEFKPIPLDPNVKY